jgi:hypothetical protein
MALGIGGCRYSLGEQARTMEDARQEFRIDRQALRQREASSFGAQAQLLQVWPGFFRVDEVGRQGRNPSPVVDACFE